MDYPQALAYVASLEPRGWRLGLDRMQAFIEKAGLIECIGQQDPSLANGGKGARFIHVAGTNGKGSVTAFLQSMLVEHGFRTGAFFSPYVVDPRERVQYGREMISEAEFAAVVSDLKPVAESFSTTEFGGITEFEFKTAVGFEYWRRKCCEWVALEVGLGGRLDATNVVHSSCSVIVSIGLDHTHILGETLEKIANEKGGIIKDGVPVVIGEMPKEAAQVIRRLAREHCSPVWEMGREIQYARLPSGTRVTTPVGEHLVHPSLVGRIQSHNVALAIAAMLLGVGEVRADALRRGAATAYVPGRFQQIEVDGVQVVLDGAHNPDAARVLARALKDRSSGRQPTVLGMTLGHDPIAFLSEIRKAVSKLYAVPIDFHRAQSPEVIANAARELGMDVQPYDSAERALRDALTEGSTVLVTGSFYLVGELLRSLGRKMGYFH